MFFDTVNRREMSEGLLQVATWPIGPRWAAGVLCGQADGQDLGLDLSSGRTRMRKRSACTRRAMVLLEVVV